MTYSPIYQAAHLSRNRTKWKDMSITPCLMTMISRKRRRETKDDFLVLNRKTQPVDVNINKKSFIGKYFSFYCEDRVFVKNNGNGN